MIPKILVVEDDADVSKLLIEVLIKIGFNAKSATNAEEAEVILKNEKIDMVLTDIKLPGTDGIKLTKNIKKKYILDVIVLTAYSAQYSYEDAIRNGASDLIFKPIKLNELLLRINRVIKERMLLNDRDKLIKQLKRLAIKDALTGLYNSRHFFDQLDKEIKRSDRYLHPISLIFIDIDNFKKINDTFGHMAGDKVLALIAKRIKACLRFNDGAYRFAGDEFTIILPETTANEAKFVAYRILSKFTHECFAVNEKDMIVLTPSIGIAEYQRNEGKKEFIHRADTTMYEAKRQGGNKVIICPDLKNLSLENWA